MKTLRQHLTEYVAARRALGTRLEETADALGQFVNFLARKRAPFITIPLALEWSQQPKDVQRATWARKLSNVRRFASWMSIIPERISKNLRFGHHGPGVIDTRRVRKPGKPTSCALSYRTHARRCIKQLRPIRQHLAFEPDRSEIFLRFVHARNVSNPKPEFTKLL